jgi:glycosyltransferase involved in cell wall biosynthesis
MPWDRNLGAPRVQVELAEEFRKRGHVVDRFSWLDAFPRRPSSKLRTVTGPTFASRARRFVRRRGTRYDVIEAQQGDLPFPKESLGFDGLLVARSCGLYRAYRDFERYSARRWPEERGTLPGRARAQWTRRREEPNERRSLDHADLINVPNRDELRVVRDELGFDGKSVFIPNGLPESRITRLGDAASDPASRLSEPTVVFIGWWATRKGAKDWAPIAHRLRQEVPGVRFVFLGTGADSAKVMADLGARASDGVKVVPYFESDDLPGMLSRATVGALPSYVEGFGLGVLEQLAAGVPTVAYDVPGPRETLRPLDPSLLTPRGDHAALAARLARVLRSTPEEYATLSRRGQDVARRFSWSRIADETLDAYGERLASVGASR